MNIKIGDRIEIICMEGEPNQTGRTGYVKHIDDAGQIHGSWSGLAIIPEKDSFKVIEEKSIKIYQIKNDECDYLFEPYQENRFNFADYQMVYECKRPIIHVDELFVEFNIYRPEDFKGHSLSMSDVVEVDGVKFYCDTTGWTKIK